MNPWKINAAGVVGGTVLAAQILTLSTTACAAVDEEDGGGPVIAVEHSVPHISSVHANAGELVELFVWERVRARNLEKFENEAPAGKVVLFVHGGSTPSVPAFDLDYKDYSWMQSLARAGYDVFSMDRTGYGFSPRPKMDDPCNVNAEQQAILIPNPLAAPCLTPEGKPAYSYPYRLSNSNSDNGEIDRVVDYIRALRRVDRITIAGWSGVGPQVGSYAVNNQAKLDKLVFYAPNYARNSASRPPPPLPLAPFPGFPMNLRSRAMLEAEWQREVACEGQFEPGIRDVVWNRIMDFEPVGRTWGPADGVMRVRTTTNWGWNANAAPTIKVPMLIIVGRNDALLSQGRDLYQDLGSEDKVLVEVPCASHYLVWETNHKILHTASKQWLRNGSLSGVRQGVLTLDADGNLVPIP